MLTKQQMSVARKVYGRCYCRRCATSGKIAGGSERFVKGVYAGIFCSECWALDERSGNTPNGSVLLNGALTAEAERHLAETPNPVDPPVQYCNGKPEYVGMCCNPECDAGPIIVPVEAEND